MIFCRAHLGSLLQTPHVGEAEELETNNKSTVQEKWPLAHVMMLFTPSCFNVPLFFQYFPLIFSGIGETGHRQT